MRFITRFAAVRCSCGCLDLEHEDGDDEERFGPCRTCTTCWKFRIAGLERHLTEPETKKA